MAEYLLININNTRTKFALADRDSIRPERHIEETRELDFAALRWVATGWDYKRPVLTSVVPEKTAFARELFGQQLLEVGHDLTLGVSLDFPNPTTIGADRLANAAGLIALFDEAPAIAVDFGSAVTFDIISAERAYVGGIIAPGLNAMTDYLHERTALLPKIEIEEPDQLIGKSTKSAMLSGAVHGYRVLVKEILQQLREELAEGGEVKTVATGGYAELISREIAGIDAVRPDLTFEGMRVIANLNPTS
ncbi:MAG: type III pantothenate kinase [Verrucomicrobiota bacterium]